MVIYIIMKAKIYPIYINSMFKLKYIVYGKGNCLYVKEDVEEEEFDYIFYCSNCENKTLCFI